MVLGVCGPIAGCSPGIPSSPTTPASGTTGPAAASPETVPRPARTATASPASGNPGKTIGTSPCAVTGPSARPSDPPKGVPRESGEDRWFGGGDLWVFLPDPRYRLDPRPQGYSVKLGWWRLAEGRLTLSAARADGGKGTATTEVPLGYAPTGFQPTGVLFSRPGCWRVTGTLNDTEVTFLINAR